MSNHRDELKIRIRGNMRRHTAAIDTYQHSSHNPANVHRFRRAVLLAVSRSRSVAVPNRKQLGSRVNFSRALHLGSANEAFDSGPIPETATGNYDLPAGLVLPQNIERSRFDGRRSLLNSLGQAQRILDSGATGSLN